MVKKFLDRLRIFVTAGSGAAGNPSIRGKGGDGGSIYLEVKEDYSLSRLVLENPTKRFKATHGKEASKRRKQLIGQNGQDVSIPVPSGITVLLGGQGNYAQSRSGAKFVPIKLGDMDKPKQRLLVAQGGLGGSPLTGYVGTAGQSHAIVLDLKLMADYSLLGFPNAGKSSLLKALSNVKVKVASYPFTTVQPQVAHCKYSDGRMISLADLPGLADIYARYPDQSRLKSSEQCSSSALPTLRHTNFLKHVERSSSILMVLDTFGFRRDQYSQGRSPLACAYLLLHLLERWSGGYLLEKPIFCVLNKIDSPGAESEAQYWLDWLSRIRSAEARKASELPDILLPRFVPLLDNIHMVSAKTGAHIPALKNALRKHLDDIEIQRRQAELSQIAKDERERETKFLFDRNTTYC